MLQRVQGDQTLLMASMYHHSCHVLFIGTKPLNSAHSQRDEAGAPPIGGKSVNKFIILEENNPGPSPTH